jgi:hypothetical protein
MRPPQGDAPPLPLLCLLPATPACVRGGGEAEAPLLTKDSRFPSPTARGRRVEGSPTVAGELGPYPHYHCTHPRGREGTPASVSRTFHFPVGRNSARATPTGFPARTPATDTGTSLGRGRPSPRFFQASSPEKIGRGREAGDAKRSRSGGGGKGRVALGPFSRPEDKLS